MNKTLKSILDMCEEEDLTLTMFGMREDAFGEFVIDIQFIRDNNGVRRESVEEVEYDSWEKIWKHIQIKKMELLYSMEIV